MALNDGSSEISHRSFGWRLFAGLFEDAWARERRRRRAWLAAIVLVAAGAALAVTLTQGRHSIVSVRPAPGTRAAVPSTPLRLGFESLTGRQLRRHVVYLHVLGTSTVPSRGFVEGPGHPAIEPVRATGPRVVKLSLPRGAGIDLAASCTGSGTLALEQGTRTLATVGACNGRMFKQFFTARSLRALTSGSLQVVTGAHVKWSLAAITTPFI